MQDTAPKPPVPAKARRRWVRFSLRTMLIGTTALCIWLGVVCNRANRQRRAVAAIERAGGIATYDTEQPGTYEFHPFLGNGLAWLSDLVGIDYFETVGCVHVGTAKHPCDDAVQAITNLPHLSEVELGWVSIPDATMSHFEGLPLRSLKIIRCKIGPVGWNSLARLTKLRTLEFNGPNMDDATLSYIRGLTNLKGLGLYQTQVTDVGLQSLKGLSQLDSLWLSDNSLITDKGVGDLQRALPGIEIDAPHLRQ